MLYFTRYCKLALVGSVAVGLAACGSSGSYRVATVGDVPSDGASSSSSGGGSSSSGGTSSGSSGGGSSSGGTSSSSGGGWSSGGSSSSSSGGIGGLGTGKIIVTAGNTVIGISNKVGGIVPAGTPVTGTVLKILTRTGQTLVNVGNGNTLILGKAGGKIGDLLTLDLGSKRVIGAPAGSALLGVGILSPAGSGNVALVTTNKPGALGGVGALLSGTTPTTRAGPLAPVTAPVTGLLGQVTTPGTGVVSKVTKPMTGLLGGLTSHP